MLRGILQGQAMPHQPLCVFLAWPIALQNWTGGLVDMKWIKKIGGERL